MRVKLILQCRGGGRDREILLEDLGITQLELAKKRKPLYPKWNRVQGTVLTDMRQDTNKERPATKTSDIRHSLGTREAKTTSGIWEKIPELQWLASFWHLQGLEGRYWKKSSAKSMATAWQAWRGRRTWDNSAEDLLVAEKIDCFIQVGQKCAREFIARKSSICSINIATQN